MKTIWLEVTDYENLLNKGTITVKRFLKDISGFNLLYDVTLVIKGHRVRVDMARSGRRYMYECPLPYTGAKSGQRQRRVYRRL